jgi:hypothetical protein
MAQERHVRGVGSKEQREYEHVVESAQKSGRYKGREKEVTARTVLTKQRDKGHSNGH